jgi:hypothetical protein
MAEHNVGDPVWDRSPGGGWGPVVLAELEVSDLLIQQLRDWNEAFESTALTGFEWPSPQVGEAWIATGWDLAYRLQNELPDIDIRYFLADDDRPLHESRNSRRAGGRPRRGNGTRR